MDERENKLSKLLWIRLSFCAETADPISRWPHGRRETCRGVSLTRPGNLCRWGWTSWAQQCEATRRRRAASYRHYSGSRAALKYLQKQEHSISQLPQRVKPAATWQKFHYLSDNVLRGILQRRYNREPVEPFHSQNRSISNFPCSPTRNITWHTWVSIAYSDEICNTNSHYLTYTFLFKRLGECTFWNWKLKVWSV